MKFLPVALALSAALSAYSAVIIEFGNDGANELPGASGNLTDAAFSDLMTNVNENSSFTVGSFSALPSGFSGAGVSFDIVAVSSAGRVRAQAEGLGVNSFASNSGSAIDNESGAEWLSFAITNVSGLGPGDRLVFTELTVLYGASGETFKLATDVSGVAPSGSDLAFTTGGNTPDVIAVGSDAFVLGTGGQGAASFALGAVAVDVIPEPAAFGLITASGAALLGLRRVFKI